MIPTIRALVVSGLLVAAPVAGADENYVVVDQGQLAPYWTSIGNLRGPHFPKSAIRNRVEACIAVGYSIEPDGKPAHVSVLRSKGNRAADDDDMKKIAAAALDSVSRWRYEAAQGNPERKAVYTYATVSMALSNTTTTPAVARNHALSVEHSCDIADFVAAVARGEFSSGK